MQGKLDLAGKALPSENRKEDPKKGSLAVILNQNPVSIHKGGRTIATRTGIARPGENAAFLTNQKTAVAAGQDAPLRERSLQKLKESLRILFIVKGTLTNCRRKLLGLFHGQREPLFCVFLPGKGGFL
jgi:hypothetical protein